MHTVKIITKRPSSLNEYELNKIEKLRLPYGSMIPTFREVKDKKDTRCILAYKNRNLVGWSLVFGPNKLFSHTKSNVHVFVSPLSRRRGIGTKLIERAVKIKGRKNLACSRWSQTSTAFFDKNRIGGV